MIPGNLVTCDPEGFHTTCQDIIEGIGFYQQDKYQCESNVNLNAVSVMLLKRIC